MVKRANKITFKDELQTTNFNHGLKELDLSNLNGLIILFAHGFDGNAIDWRSCMYQIERHQINNTLVFKDHYLTSKSNINTAHIYQRLMLDDVKTENKTIFIRTEFQNRWSGEIADQVKELLLIIQNIKAIVGINYRFALVGHSKGGLVNLEFALNYPQHAKNLVSINTPYFGLKNDSINQLWNIFARKYRSLGIKKEIELLYSKWQKETIKPLVSAIATADDGNDDRLVPVSSALGLASDTSFMNNKKPYDFFDTITLSGSGLYYRHLGALGNVAVTYNIIKQLIMQMQNVVNQTG